MNRMKITSVFFASFLIFTVTNLSAKMVESTHMKNTPKTDAVEVSPVEDLMREHGVLSRVLLIYEEISKRLNNNESFPPNALINSTEIIRTFIHEYHEMLEEKYIFVKFNHANKQLRQLTEVLKQQHQDGYKIIQNIMAEKNLSHPDSKKKLVSLLGSFIRIYRPHKAREDTVLFPALHALVSEQEYNKLGEIFEDEEQRRFGKNGFEKIVKQIEAIETSLGIYNLAQFSN